MVKRIAVALIYCLGYAWAMELAEIIDKTVQQYEKMQSFYAEFTQVMCDKAAGICQNFEGVVYYLKPNYFRMEIKKPKQILVGDSSSLWIYLPEKKRAIRQNLGQVPFALNPDIFLKEYEERFHAQLNKTDRTFEITLTPKEETEIYKKIVVSIHNTKFEITGITIVDEVGAVNSFSFEKTQLNKKMSKKLFEFKPAKGTEIIEQ